MWKATQPHHAKILTIWPKVCGHQWKEIKEILMIWHTVFLQLCDNSMCCVPFLFQHDNVRKVRPIKKCLSQFGVEEFDWPAQSPHLNSIQHLGWTETPSANQALWTCWTWWGVYSSRLMALDMFNYHIRGWNVQLATYFVQMSTYFWPCCAISFFFNY